MQKNLRVQKTIDPPSEIQQLARQEELGELRKVYPVTRNNTIIFGMGMLLAVFGVMFIFIGICMIFSLVFPPSEPPLMPPPL
jgi:hypothetical protein